jgi:transposase InsO family protein
VELRRRGFEVNHKRVSRLMREDNLLAIRHRRFVITTDAQHELEVYLNLAKRMQPTAANQLWIADLTYIRLHREFVYLAVILDKWSRRVVGWALDRTLAARLAVTALQNAIAARQPKPGLVHHSDRGIQYASADYVAVLQEHQMTPSMSRPANPYDNATCESFMKTLKQEEIYCREYRDLEDLQTHLEDFLDRYYNQRRLHSALGYRTPEEFEGECGDLASTEETDAEDEFFQAWEIYRSDVCFRNRWATPMRSPTVIVSDEFPAGYSSAGCSPAEPASAFPDVDILLDERKKVVEDYSEWGSVFIPRVSPEGFTPAARSQLCSPAAPRLPT